MTDDVFPETRLIPSRIGAGTWSAGGAHWGGTDPEQGIRGLQAAFLRGMNVVDTSPAFGYGLSEELTGSAIRDAPEHERSDFIVITRVCLSLEMWQSGHPGQHLRSSLEQSLERLQMERVDACLVAMNGTEGDLASFRPSNSDLTDEIDRLRQEGKLGVPGFFCHHPELLERMEPDLFPVLMLPLNLFEQDLFMKARERLCTDDFYMLTCGTLCRGLLGGDITASTAFPRDDFRKEDPKFVGEEAEVYREAVQKMKLMVRREADLSLPEAAARWSLSKGSDTALWGVRHPDHTEVLPEDQSFTPLPADIVDRLDRIVEEYITHRKRSRMVDTFAIASGYERS